MSAIRTEKLSKRYGDTLALDSSTLTPRRATCTGTSGRTGPGRRRDQAAPGLASAKRRRRQAVRGRLLARPGLGAIGVVAGYLAVLVGPTFYARRRLGARTWRKLHRILPIAYLLVLRAVPTGTDKFGVVLLWHVLRAEQTSGD